MAPSYHYLVAPAIAMIATGVLALLLRWTYGSGTPPPPPRAAATDFGLLVPVATVPDAAAAARLRALLTGHRIRATVGRDPAGAALVLVFADDEQRARELLTRSAG